MFENSSSAGGILGSILVLIIVLAILGVTAYIVVTEFKNVYRKVDVNQEVAEDAVVGLHTNVKTNYLLKGEFATASNSIVGRFGTVDTALEEQKVGLQGASASNASLQRAWDTYFTGAKLTIGDVVAASNLSAPKLSLGSGSNQAGVTLAQGSGGELTASNLRSAGTNDADFNRLRVGQSLNMGGKLNFATTNSSYMLGVDGTSMYLKLADETASKFTIRGPNDTPAFTVDKDANAAFGSDVTVRGCVKQPGSGSASVCFDNNTLNLNGTRVQVGQSAQLSIGSYTLKEDAVGQLVVSRGNTDVLVLNPAAVGASNNTLVVRNLGGGSHTIVQGGSSNLGLIS